jgi:hypothetical protein
VIAVIYGLGALGLGTFLLLRWHKAASKRNERHLLDRPVRGRLDLVPEPALSRVDEPCDCVCCAPQRVTETLQPRDCSVLPVVPLRNEHEAPLVHQESR